MRQSCTLLVSLLAALTGGCERASASKPGAGAIIAKVNGT